MKKIIPLLIMFFSIALTQQVFAQEKTVSGTVTSVSDNTPVPGVGVVVQGTARGTETDFDGNFSLQVSEGNVLIFSFLGMKTVQVTVGSSNNISVAMEEDAAALDEVVITALGIKKEKKALTYSAQEVGGEDLTKVKQTNPINSLSGKSAGVTITKSSSGAGGAAKVVLRGNSSTTNNDPLYVIDGVPMSNNGNGQNGESPGSNVFGSQIGNRDGGDAISMLNPDDIASMTVLKGASAAALYGSQGANGVILITTKTGKEGKLSVNFNSSLTVDNVISLPELQSEYQSASVGQSIAANGNVADPKSWGAKTNGLSNDSKSFFNTGHTSIQSVSLTAGNKKAQTYFSYANTLAKGVTPNNGLVRNNLTLRETASFLDDKVSVSASVNLSDQRINNRPTNGLYSNPLTGVYLHPVGIDRNIYKNKYEYFNAATNMMDQYSTSFDENIQQNPYWLINRNKSKDIAQRVFASASVSYQISDDLAIQSRASFDKSNYTFDKRMHAGSDLTFVPATGRYILEKTENTQQYLDLIATYNKDINEEISFSGVLGTSLTKYSIGDQVYLDSGNGKGLTYPNYFSISNFAETKDLQQSVGHREVQSVFGSANISFNNKYFLDITGRTDWSSTLVNTDSKSFFYPSVGLTGVLSDIFELPDAISFAKIRGSYAEVGKDIPAYATIPLNTIPLGQNNFQKPQFGVKQGETLRPERQKSFEIGTEWRFLGNRFGIDLTYYSSKTSDQIFYIAAEPNVHGYVQNIVNAGELSNEGIELVVNGKPIVNDDFTWNTSINFAKNSNKVISVHPSLQDGEAILTAPGVNGYGYSLVEGEDFGSIRGRSIIRNANGLPIVTDDGNGALTLESTSFETIAHAQPDFTLGWNNSIDYKNFTFNILIDAKVGGDVVSVTEAVNDFYGVSQASANARNLNGGMIDVVDSSGNALQMTAQDYYTKTGGRAGLLGEYVYDATNVSLRELSVGYNMIFKNSFVDNMRLSVIANNLFFIYKEAPFDPNVAASTGIGLQGVDIYGQPSTRSVGLNINVNF
ncbi:SusC/RagA family TonB-linked outer membrane protein [Bacteroidota bacterium]